MSEVNDLINKEIEKKIDYLIQAEDQGLVSYDENGNVVNIQYLKDIKAYIEKLEKDSGMLEILKKDRRISKLWPSEEFIEYPSDGFTESVSESLLHDVVEKLGW